ncbi:MAG: M13 family metallopeptidase [Terriglobales bacterium]
MHNLYRLLAAWVVALLLLLVCTAQAQNVPASPAFHGIDPAALDRSVNPCVDFYAYACGGWEKSNPIPPDQSSWSVYSKLQEENRRILRDILEAAAVERPERSSIEQKIGDYYASCMDEKHIEEMGIKPLQPELTRIANIQNADHIADLLAHLHARDLGIYFGQAALFSFGSEQDAKDSTQTIAGVDQGGLSLPDRDYYLKTDARSEQLRKDFVAHVQKVFELLGDNPEIAAAGAQTVLKIETALAKASLSRVERRDPYAIYHKMTRAELLALSPTFPWDRYFAGLGVGKIESLNVAVPQFIKAMDAELAAHDLNAWKTYLRWHLVHSQARWLPAAFVQEDFNFYSRKLTGARELQPRWKRCVRYTDRALGEAVGQAYVAKYFSAEAKQRALKMVQSIEAAMHRDIEQLPWMSDATKKQAIAKLRTVVNKTGYPDKWRDYSALNIVRGDPLGNGERANAFEFHRQLNKIGKPLERGEWFITPPTVNAYYNPQMNDINFPAGVLQPPLFDAQADDASNYGNTGATIGHELTHGFDDQGRQFDAQGNLRDWWTEADAKEFNRRASCISEQYSQYTIVDDVKINGKLTLGEDVADLGGLLLAYMAWQDATRGQKPQPKDGLTPVQRFFVAYGQSWCSNQRPEVQRMRAISDPHSPPRWRTNGVVSNMPEFREAFGCKPPQPMARENACRVW